MRPDLEFVAPVLGYDLHKPTKRHITILKSFVRYLKSTGMKILFYQQVQHPNQELVTSLYSMANISKNYLMATFALMKPAATPCLKQC